MLIVTRFACWLTMVFALAHTGCAALGGNKSSAAASITDQTPTGETAVKQASYEDTPVTKDVKESEPSWWESLSPTAMSKSAKDSYQWATGTAPNPELSKKLYAQAEAQYRDAVSAPQERKTQLLMEAAAKYTEAAKRWPDSALEQDGLYMAGESYFFADAYSRSNDMYERLIKKYPGTKYMDTIDARRYVIAQYWLELTSASPESTFYMNFTNQRKPWRDTRGHALRVYDRIRIDDPTGKLADDATLAAANAHFIAANYMKADEYYGDLRKAFPSSEHQFRAHFLGLKTKLLCYQGSDYAGDALDEADKLIKQIRKQFPKEAQEEKEFLARAYAEVRFKKAEREWDMAQYFIKRSEYGAARMYQQTCVDEYHDTPFAERAKAQLAEQASYPDVPAKHFQWVVDMFPREKPAKPLFYSDAPAPKRK